MAICDVCGNDVREGSGTCRFCGASQGPVIISAIGFLHKTVNLEKSRPIVQKAMERLESELRVAKAERVRVLTLIHGYGSSGKGGVIRSECRKCLEYLSSIGEIRDYIPGEEFSVTSNRVKELIRRLPGLATNRNLGRHNPGITVVVLQ